MSSKLIYFVRHGESELNRQGIRQGPGGALSELGQAQTKLAAKKFPRKRGRPEIILSSPFERTRETAGIIAEELGLPIEFSELLVERRNPSEIVGHTEAEPETKKIVDLIDKSFHDDSWRYSDEENFTDLKVRARKLLEYIPKRKEKRILMVTHKIFLKMIVAYMLHGEKLTASVYNTLSFFNPIDNAGLTIVKYEAHWFRPPEWKILVWNDEG
ncbi:MAG: histidine phosphatase family protein [Patescibacteria group bacterium]